MRGVTVKQIAEFEDLKLAKHAEVVSIAEEAQNNIGLALKSLNAQIGEEKAPKKVIAVQLVHDCCCPYTDSQRHCN